MSLQDSVMTALKTAMKSKDTVALTALRSIKSAILLARTSGSDAKLTEEDEFKLLQKLVKQRRDSAAIFMEQNRTDLADPELAEIAVLEKFLPEAMSEEAIAKAATAAPAATVRPAFQIAPLRSAIYYGTATNVPYGVFFEDLTPIADVALLSV